MRNKVGYFSSVRKNTNIHFPVYIGGTQFYVHKPVDIADKYIGTPIALMFIKSISKTSITPNQVTILSLILALIATVIISFSNYRYNLIACLILQIALVLDSIDGILARYKGKFTKFGVYMEFLFHEIVPASLFFALGINSYKYLDNVIPLYLGGLVVLLIFFINIIKSSKERIVLKHIQKSKKIPKYVESRISGSFNKPSLGKFVAKVIDMLNSPNNLFTILLLLSLFNILHYTIFFYTLFYFFIAIAKGYVEFRQGFKPYGLE